MSLQEIKNSYLTVSQIASLLQKPIHRVHNWISLGHLKAEKVFTSVVVSRADFERFQRERADLIEGKAIEGKDEKIPF